MQKLTISLPDDVANSLTFFVKKGKKSDFVAGAIREKLRAEAKRQAYKEVAKLHPVKIKQDSIEVLRKIREERSEDLNIRHNI